MELYRWRENECSIRRVVKWRVHSTWKLIQSLSREEGKNDYQLLEMPGLLPRLVASQHPGSRGSVYFLESIFSPRRYLDFLGHLFQDVIAQVKDVNPVIELAFS